MAQVLVHNSAGFADAFAKLLSARGARLDEAEAAAREVLNAVRTEGMAAVLRLTAKFDGLVLTEDSVRVPDSARKRARAACQPDLIAALEVAAERIFAFHSAERPQNRRWTDAVGVEMGWRWTPVEAAGLYAPGGLAAYPSSVLMNAMPAKAAGVDRLVMVTPPARLHDNPAILAAADIAGVDEIWAIGGAQAIAALAYGAGPLRRTDVIVGPGNAYVAAAKRLVFGDVGIDSIAGPSEVFILTDGTAPPAWIAADLLAQAEHDPDAQSVVFVTDRAYGELILAEVEAMLEAGEAGASADVAWARHGAVIVVEDLSQAVRLVDQAAPEHVQIACADPEPLAAAIRHAGAIFLGLHAPEALGDYLAGPNHVLPTGQRARFASGLSCLTFLKRTTLIGASAAGLSAVGGAAARIADAEGLPAHAASLRRRIEG